MEEILDYILDFVFPKEIKGGQYLTTEDDKQFSLTRYTSWERKVDIENSNLSYSIHNYFEGAAWNSGLLWKSMESSLPDFDEKANRSEESKIYPVIHAALYKNDVMKRLVHQAKFNSEWVIAKQVGQQIGVFLYSLLDQRSFLLYEEIIITYIPPDINRLNQRGFHLPKIIAEQAFKKIKTLYKNKNSYFNSNIELKPSLCVNRLEANQSNNVHLLEALLKNKNTERQTQLTKEQRQKNIQNTFEINTQNIQKLDFLNKNISNNNKNQNTKELINTANSKSTLWIIIDDVTTTGATINEAAVTIQNYFQQFNCTKNNIKIVGLCWLFAE